MNNSWIINTIKRLESPSTSKVISTKTDIPWEKSKGLKIWDYNGNEYIDMTSGSGVLNVGHNNTEVNEAIIKQLSNITHTGWQFPVGSRAELLEKLSNYVPFKNPKFIFTVTGSEAVESALKVARNFKKRPAVLSFQGGFHGKTGGSLEVTANPSFREGNSFISPSTLRLPYPEDEAFYKGDENCISVNEYINWIEKLIDHPDFPTNQIAGIIVEPVQGASGMTAPPKNFLVALRELTQRLDLLLIIDEIYTGVGRTGKFFGYEHSGIIPDLIIMGKALGNGIPISLVVGNAEILDEMPPYKQTSTFSGNPLACSAALSVLSILERDNLLDSALEKGNTLKYKLQSLTQELSNNSKLRVIVTGRGLMIGVRFEANTRENSSILASKINNELKKQRVIALLGGTYSNVIKLTPPLTISDSEIDLICGTFRTSIKNVMKTIESEQLV
ncbi:aspartate aminotransferase family protein [Priestia aryabhattai]|uniref:aspartate aminotransferase family protein n=1 Tax=Priestia aryabhattai TaxID=412384 RepID=UPI003982B448